MFRFASVVAGGLALSGAAAVATVFTLATATPSIGQFHISKPGLELKPNYDVNRTAKGDRLPVHLTFPQVTVPKTNNNGIVNENPLERTLDRTTTPDQSTPRTLRCESGLSPDISPTVPTNARSCVAQLKQSRRTAV